MTVRGCLNKTGRTDRYKENGEILLILLPSEEKGMVQLLLQKKVPVKEIRWEILGVWVLLLGKQTHEIMLNDYAPHSFLPLIFSGLVCDLVFYNFWLKNKHFFPQKNVSGKNKMNNRTCQLQQELMVERIKPLGCNYFFGFLSILEGCAVSCHWRYLVSRINQNQCLICTGALETPWLYLEENNLEGGFSCIIHNTQEGQIYV